VVSEFGGRKSAVLFVGVLLWGTGGLDVGLGMEGWVVWCMDFGRVLGWGCLVGVFWGPGGGGVGWSWWLGSGRGVDMWKMGIGEGIGGGAWLVELEMMCVGGVVSGWSV